MGNANSVTAGGKMAMNAVVIILAIVILLLITGLVAGTLLVQSVFTTSNIINVTEFETQYAAFVSGLIGFFGVLGVIVAIVLLIVFIKPVFDKKDGVQTFAGS